MRAATYSLAAITNQYGDGLNPNYPAISTTTMTTITSAATAILAPYRVPQAPTTPVLIAPAVLRRRPVAVISAGLSATVIVYLPHVLAVGSGVIGFLPGYLQQEGYANGSRFLLVGILVPGKWGFLAAFAILATAALLVLLRGDPDRPGRGAVVMTGLALAVATPPFPWYAMLLVMLVAFDGRVEWLGFAMAPATWRTAHPCPGSGFPSWTPCAPPTAWRWPSSWSRRWSGGAGPAPASSPHQPPPSRRRPRSPFSCHDRGQKTACPPGAPLSYEAPAAPKPAPPAGDGFSVLPSSHDARNSSRRPFETVPPGRTSFLPSASSRLSDAGGPPP